MPNLFESSMQEIEKIGIFNFISGLFDRQQFTIQAFKNSFLHVDGWLELGIALAIAIITFWLSAYWIRKHPVSVSSYQTVFRHIGQRILWPVLILPCAIIAVYFWNLSGKPALWFSLLAALARWLIIIRLILAIVHSALPACKASYRIQQFLSVALWGAFILWISGIENIIHALKSVTLPVGSTQLSLYTILVGLLWAAAIIVLAMWLARLLNSKLMDSQSLDINLRIMLTKIINSVMVVFAILITLPLVGIDLTVLSVFGGALGVGIGFGLQKVASNYISGFIILGDRSIRPGDRLTVNNFTGYVTKITSRFIVLKNITGSEALIPNETFITSTVINESYTSKALWQSLNIQVAYRTDLVKAMSILEESAAAQERVESTPPPRAAILSFGDNGIELRIGFWVKDPENGFSSLFSAILFKIWQRFKVEGIEFPYPQREIRILNETQPIHNQTMPQILPEQTATAPEKDLVKRKTGGENKNTVRNIRLPAHIIATIAHLYYIKKVKRKTLIGCGLVSLSRLNTIASWGEAYAESFCRENGVFEIYTAGLTENKLKNMCPNFEVLKADPNYQRNKK